MLERLRSPALALILFAICTVWPIAAPQGTPRRIVSLIPAVTEMLFAIGAGPQVVGVSSFDRFPPEVERVTKVGGLLDPDLERILSLKPDLVVIFDTQTELRTQLERAGIAVYRYRDGGLADVTQTIRALGQRAGRTASAAQLAGDIERRIAAIRRRARSMDRRPRTLVVLGREPMALRGIYVSGGIGFIHDMVEAADGENVFKEVKRRGLQATTEMILAKRPDVILEVRASDVSDDVARREAAVWNGLAIPAVAMHRVFMLRDDRIVVPGPRVAEGVEVIASALERAR
jgi:iron complex transport system substrate-binding protein